MELEILRQDQIDHKVIQNGVKDLKLFKVLQKLHTC